VIQHFQLHGLGIRVVSDNPAVGQMLHRTLRYKGASAVSSGTTDLTLDFSTTRAHVPIPESARLLGQSDRGGISVWKTPSRMFLCRGDATVVLHVETGTAEATLTPSVLSAHDHHRRDPLFYLITSSLVILLRYGGWYALHTAALALDGRGLLLVAQSDSGKSTATLNLVRQGWHYLSDDTVLLHAEDDRVQAYTFRRRFCLDPDATAYFPALDGHDWPPSLSDAEKWQVDVDRLYPGRFAPVCTPRVLVLPVIVDSPESHVEPVDAKVALAQLVDQGALFLTPSPDVARRHLDVLAQLVNQSRAYQLRAGRDLLRTSRTIHTLLAPLLRANSSPAQPRSA
jgi:hypothetical protein